MVYRIHLHPCLVIFGTIWQISREHWFFLAIPLHQCLSLWREIGKYLAIGNVYRKVMVVPAVDDKREMVFRQSEA